MVGGRSRMGDSTKARVSGRPGLPTSGREVGGRRGERRKTVRCRTVGTGRMPGAPLVGSELSTSGVLLDHPMSITLALLIPTILLAQAPPREDDPTINYQPRSVEGFTVFVNRRLLEHKSQADETLSELTSQLRKIT